MPTTILPPIGTCTTVAEPDVSHPAPGPQPVRPKPPPRRRSWSRHKRQAALPGPIALLASSPRRPAKPPSYDGELSEEEFP